ncbi:MAG: hypothetical protein GJ676_05530 [Rhodobacteraceae bacterium]|nr:hypothetical protein [Paracoccaceae bacterium]
MGYLSDWKAAKKKYDAAHKEAFKQLGPLEEQFNAAKFYVEAAKKGKSGDDKYMKKKIGKYADELTWHSADKALKRLPKEMNKLYAIPKRETFGMETVLRDLEKVVEVGEKMVAKQVMDAEKWEKYRKAQRATTGKLVKVAGRFKQFVGGDKSSAKTEFKKDLDKILNDIGQRNQTVKLFFEREIEGRRGGMFVNKDDGTSKFIPERDLAKG